MANLEEITGDHQGREILGSTDNPERYRESGKWGCTRVQTRGPLELARSREIRARYREIQGNLEWEIQGAAKRSVQDTRRLWIGNPGEIEGES
jgi:hypothetical protein